MKAWTFDNIPDQTGRTAIVTGANTGIGLETARMLARKGAHVVLGCRNLEKGEAAVERIRGENPAGKVHLEILDLADLESVAAFAGRCRETLAKLDLLINNAGLMIPPLGRTKQGFELQLGTNHLGHFALTSHLLPLLLRTPGARAVIVASLQNRFGRFDFDDLNWERKPYKAWGAYGQSKLANLSFALELQRRLTAAGAELQVTSAHPGMETTELQRHMPVPRFARFFTPRGGARPTGGALPTLRAATDPSALAGSYWGRKYFFELKGPPVQAHIPDKAKDRAAAVRLWEVSEKLTGVSFRIPAASGAVEGGHGARRQFAK